jgi:hypothetical protein
MLPITYSDRTNNRPLRIQRRGRVPLHLDLSHFRQIARLENGGTAQIRAVSRALDTLEHGSRVFRQLNLCRTHRDSINVFV